MADRTIIMPTQTVRADGIAPVSAVYERAVFSHPGLIGESFASLRWTPQIPVRLDQVLVVTLSGTGTFRFMKNNGMVGEVNVEGFLTQYTFTGNVNLNPGVDTLWVLPTVVSMIENVSMFVSFGAPGG